MWRALNVFTKGHRFTSADIPKNLIISCLCQNPCGGDDDDDDDGGGGGGGGDDDDEEEEEDCEDDSHYCHRYQKLRDVEEF